MTRGTRPITLPPPLGDLEGGTPAWKRLGAVVLVLSAFGVFFGIFAGGFRDLWEQGQASDWSWWHYLLALPVMGGFYLVLWGVGEAILRLLVFTFSPLGRLIREYPGWGRAIKWSMVALIAFVLLYAPYFFFTLND